MRLFLLLMLALAGNESWLVTAQAAAAATPVWTEADWLGRSRDEVVERLGRPLSALQRGDTEVLMYAKDVRIEIREDEVVSYRAGGGGAAIVARDGTRYQATERGKVRRVAGPPEEEENEDEDDAAVAVAAVTPVAAPARPAATPPVRTKNPTPPAADIDASLDEGVDDAAEEAADEAAEPADDFTHPISQAIEDLSEGGMMPGVGPEEEPSTTVTVITGIVQALLRFGCALLMLRIAIAWVGLPCYMPDVSKVAALYVVVREGMHGLARFGGHWEWIPLFRLDDGVSYFAMMYLLFKFKVALSGLTALQIATATKAVTYFLMLIAGVAISFLW